ncbi:MAG: choice-of-anchor I domain-containing protein, partial [Deinococcales bacterium]
KINIQNYPVFGAYMPDAIATINIAGATFLLSANEGDSRDYGKSFLDEARVSSLTLDPTIFPNADVLKADAALGRLTVSNLEADTDGDKDADRLVAFGARSVSLWDARVNLVADTGDLLERKTAELFPSSFNSNGTNGTFDTRSDNKGPEPEGVVTGVVDGKTYIFVGLERTGGIVVLDASTLRFRFVDYAHFITPSAAPNSGTAGDLGPEGLIFIPADQSPTGQALLVASYEVSGSVTLYSVASSGKLTRVGRYQAQPFAYNKGAAEISAYDPISKQLFVVNGSSGGLDILNIADPTQPKFVRSISLAKYGRAANSVAVSRGLVAVAVESNVKTDPGKVALLNTDGTERAPAITVGALPDMLTFTPNGQLILVANEGEPNADYSIDPAGSVSIINVAKALAQQ